MSVESIRQAYFLGRQNQQADQFLGHYEKELHSSSGTNIEFSKVEFLTPFAQIVKQSRFDIANENGVDADQEYQKRSWPLRMHAWCYLSVAYGSWFEQFAKLLRHSSISVSQLDKRTPRKTDYSKLCSGHRPEGIGIELPFDARQFRPSPVQIMISSGEGQRLEAIFSLDDLK
jgi:hypothetical protein